MTLPEALPLVFTANARITRRVWASARVYVSVIEGKLCITGYASQGDNDPRPHPLVLTESDWFGDDWEVVE